MTNLTSTPQSEPQMRFNGGFHNGADDLRKERGNKWAGQEHFDSVYRTGYLIGYATAQRGESTETSFEAWSASKFWGDV